MFQVTDSCGPEVAALKRSIRRLENKLLIGTWQIEHLQMHKYFQPFQSAVSQAKPETDTDSGGNQKSGGTLDSSNMTQMKPLPPAGNLIVHDKGKKSANTSYKCLCGGFLNSKITVWDEPTVHKRILKIILIDYVVYGSLICNIK